MNHEALFLYVSSFNVIHEIILLPWAYQLYQLTVKDIEYFRRAGFGVGMGRWTKVQRTLLVTGLAALKKNPMLAIYFGGIVGYLSHVVRVDRAYIIGRLQRYFQEQFNILEEEYKKLTKRRFKH